MAYRILGDADASADAAQNAFLRAYQALGQYRDDSFTGWLLRIVTNCCYDQLCARQRQPTTSLEVLVAADPTRGPSLAYQAESSETHTEWQDLGQVIQAGPQCLATGAVHTPNVYIVLKKSRQMAL